MAKFLNLGDLLRARCKVRGDQILYVFHDEHDNKTALTYAELLQQSTFIADQIAEKYLPGDVALLIYPPGLDFIIGFFACVFAGVIAVPVYPPVTSTLVDKLRNIMLDCKPKILLTTQNIAQQMRGLRLLRTAAKFPLAKALLKRFAAKQYALSKWPMESVECFISDKIYAEKPTDLKRLPKITPNSIAFLQYTSGSTGNPKGVMVTHANLLANLEIIRRAFQIQPGEIGASWLPPYHDMGLIGGILEPLYAHLSTHLFSPMTFLRRPYRWLKLISDYRVNISGGPNFSYEMCVKHISAAQRKSLDLSCWRVAFNGAEPIKADTLQRFSSTFADCGFSALAHYPCYGLAEATLFVSGATAGSGYRRYSAQVEILQQQVDDASQPEERKVLVSSGRPFLEVKIVDPETHKILPDNTLGEVWVHSSSVTAGYWKDKQKTEECFAAKIAGDNTNKAYLRTGDLAFMNDGELFITGRIKDLIIIRGRNYYPQDIEHIIEQAHDAIRAGCVAAFALSLDNGEGIGVVCELNSEVSTNEYVNIFRAMNKEVASHQQTKLQRIILIPAKNIPKTTSGKLRRFLCREMLLKKKFPVLAQWPSEAD